MKKIVAVILALSLSIGMFTACGSDSAAKEKTQATISSLSGDEVEKIIKHNNEYAKIIYNAIQGENYDRVVDSKAPFPAGKYFLELSLEDSKLQNEKIANISDVETIQKVLIVNILGEDFEDNIPIVYIETGDHGDVKKVAYSEKESCNYAGQYPDKTTRKTTFNIYDLK